MSKLATPEDALPLLANKIAPRQFDLSYRFSNISLRDQIVRAQTLIRTLVNTGLVSSERNEADAEFQLLICGAGAAGLAAAKEAEAHGISFVLAEKGKDVPGGVLGKDAQRYVSTAMYEWPHPNHAEHGFPLCAPTLLGTDLHPFPSLTLSLNKPVLIKSFGKKMRSALAADISKWRENGVAYQNGLPLEKRSVLLTQVELSKASKIALKRMLGKKVSIHGVPLTNTPLPDIELESVAGTTISSAFRFEYVIYAVGFPAEVKTYADQGKPYEGFMHTPFWEKDQISKPQLGFASRRPHVGILGSGDGALQDALRCMVRGKYAHPLAIWNGLMRCEQDGKSRLQFSRHIRAALAKVAAADGYTTGGAIWNHQTHLFKSLDDAFKEIIDELVVLEGGKLQHAVETMARDDVEQVTIVTRDGYFSKAYALNRFLVLLFHKLLATSTKPNSVKLDLRSGEVLSFEETGSDRRGAKIQLVGSLTPMLCDVVIIRGGLDRSNPPSQQIGLTGKDTGRAELGRIPPPIRPVSLPLAPKSLPAPGVPARKP